jgi:hypothetical protein
MLEYFLGLGWGATAVGLVYYWTRSNYCSSTMDSSM